SSLTVSADTLVFTSAALAQSIGDCGAIGIQLDNGGAPVVTSSEVTLLLGWNGSAGLFSDSGCSLATTTVAIPVGASSATVYLRDDVAESVSVTVASTPSGGTIFSQTETIAATGCAIQIARDANGSATVGVPYRLN